MIPLCGGNIDTTILGRCLDRGLAADGRLVKFSVTVSDRPGGIAELAKTLCDLGVSVKDMMHERAWIKNDIFSVEVNCKLGCDVSLVFLLIVFETSLFILQIFVCVCAVCKFSDRLRCRNKGFRTSSQNEAGIGGKI